MASTASESESQTRPPGFRRWRLAVIYILFVFFIIESALRIAFAVPAFQDLLFVNESLSWQRQWVSRHRESGSDAFYSFDRYDEDLGWVAAPNVRDLPVWNGKYLNTNSLGFRGTEEFPVARVPGRQRILILGDSFTFGDEVSDNELYAAYLRQMLPDAEVINMGVHGYGHDQMLLLFLEEGIQYHADVVVLGYVNTDLERNVLAFRDFAKPVFKLRDGELVLEHSPVPSPESVLRWDWLRPRVLDAAAIITQGAAIRSGERAAYEQAVTRAIFDQLVEAIRFSGAVPVFAYLPYGSEIESQETVTPSEAFFFDYCGSNPAVNCFSARPLFTRRLAAGIDVRSVLHWAAPGHQAVADALYEYLVVEAGLISAR